MVNQRLQNECPPDLIVNANAFHRRGEETEEDADGERRRETRSAAALHNRLQSVPKARPLQITLREHSG